MSKALKPIILNPNEPIALKLPKNVKYITKKSGKDLLIFEEGNETPIAVYQNYESVATVGDLSSLPHFADATAVAATTVASDATATAIVAEGGISWGYVAGGLAVVGGGAALAGGGGGGGSSTPAAPVTDTTTPTFTSGTSATSIIENTGAAQAIYTAHASDASSVTYSLKNTGDYSFLSINSATGQVTLTPDPDFETKSSYSFTVIATDSAGNSAERAITLAINDADDSAPVVTSSNTASVAENITTSTAVYTATVTDQNAVTYTMDGTDSALFNIDATSGVVTFKISPDFENPTDNGADNGYSIAITATDVIGNSHRFGVSISVTDVVENTTSYLIDSAVSGVDYYINGELKGQTGADGSFSHKQGDKVTFKIGNVTLGEITPNTADHEIYLQDLAGVGRDQITNDAVIKMAQFLQSLDNDNNPNNGIVIDSLRLKDDLDFVTLNSDTDVATLLDNDVNVVSPEDALSHANQAFLSGTDDVSPTAYITISEGQMVVGQSATVIVKFSEEIRVFGNIVTSGSGTLTPVATGTFGNQMMFTFTANTNITDTAGLIKVSNSYTDLAGNRGIGAQSKSATVNNTAPTASSDFIIGVEDTLKEGNLPQASDAQSDSIIYKIGSISPTKGSIAINPDGSYVYTPNKDINGTDSFSYIVKDSKGASNEYTVMVKIGALNDAPIAIDDTATTAQNTAVKIDVLANDTDVEHDKLTLKTATATYGTVVINGDGTLSYTPSKDFSGNDTITYNVSDGKGGEASGKVGVTVEKPSYENIDGKIIIDGASAGRNIYPKISVLEDGGYAIVWFNYTTYNTFFQKFESNGVPSGNIIEVNEPGFYDAYPNVIALKNGGYAIAWTHRDMNSVESENIFVQLFDNNGIKRSEIIKLDGHGYSDTNTKITALNDGGYAVAWESMYKNPNPNSSNIPSEINVQKFDSNGNKLGEIVSLNRNEGLTYQYDSDPEIISVGTNGEFVVTWNGNDETVSMPFMQKFDSTGKPVGETTRLLDNVSGYGFNPEITAVGNNGEFVITFGGRRAEDSTSGIFVQKFDSNGNKYNNLVFLPALDGEVLNRDIASMGSSGDFVVTWQSVKLSLSNNIYMQMFHNDGSLSGSQIKISDEDYSLNLPKVVSVGSNGEFVIAWQGWNGLYYDDRDLKVFVQKYDSSGMEVGSKIIFEDSLDFSTEFQIASIGSNGEFVVTGINDGENVVVQQFASDGKPIGSHDSPSGQSVIDLGDYGKLIAPVHIDNDGDGTADSWFYYWDRSGDGTSASSGSLNGGKDYTAREVLDSIFKYDINGNLDTDGKTDNTYRYATLNGVKVALPTLVGGSDRDYLLDNQAYTDLAEIWDTYNNGYEPDATPPGWQSMYYWSATPSANGHSAINLDDGFITEGNVDNNLSVVLQVLDTPVAPINTDMQIFTDTLNFHRDDISYFDGVGGTAQTYTMDETYTLNLGDYLGHGVVSFDGYEVKEGYDFDLSEQFPDLYNTLAGVIDDPNIKVQTNAWLDIDPLRWDIDKSKVVFDLDASLKPGNFDIDYDVSKELQFLKQDNTIYVGTKLLNTVVDTDFSDLLEELNASFDITTDFDISGKISAGYSYALETIFGTISDKEEFIGNLADLNQTINVFDISLDDIKAGINEIELNGKSIDEYISDVADEKYTFKAKEHSYGRKDSVGNPVEIGLNMISLENLGEVESENIYFADDKELDYVDAHATLNPWSVGNDLVQAKIDVDDTIGLLAKPASLSDLHMNVANITSKDYQKASDTGKIVYDALAKLNAFGEELNEEYYADDTGYTKIDDAIEGIINGIKASSEINGSGGIKLQEFNVPFMKETQDLSFEFDATLLGFDINAGISPMVELNVDIQDVLFDITVTSTDDVNFKQIVHGTLGEMVDFALIDGLTNIDIDIDYSIQALADIDLLAKLNIGFDMKLFGINGTMLGQEIPNIPENLIDFGNGIGSDGDYLIHMPQNGSDEEHFKYDLFTTNYKLMDITSFYLNLPSIHEHYTMDVSKMTSSTSTIPSGISFGPLVQTGFTDSGTYFVELDSYGNLVNPEKVDKDGDGAKETYYFSWDMRNNDYEVDGAYTDYLYGMFNNDINGITGEVDGEHRYAQLGGVTLALSDEILGYGLGHYVDEVKLEVVNHPLWIQTVPSGTTYYDDPSDNGSVSTTPGAENGGAIEGGGSNETAPEGSGTTTTSTVSGGDNGAFPIAMDTNQNGDIDYGFAMIDMDSDGVMDKTAWAAEGDGVLMWDRDMSRTFGADDVFVFGRDGLSDLQGLMRDFDTDKNGLFDESDESFGEFGVLIGDTLSGLDTFGIVSIALVSDGVVSHPTEGVTEFGRTYAMLNNGNQMVLSDAAFAYHSVI